MTNSLLGFMVAHGLAGRPQLLIAPAVAAAIMAGFDGGCP